MRTHAARQLSMNMELPPTSLHVFPTVQVDDPDLYPAVRAQIKAAALDNCTNLEVWRIDERSQRLAYATHGFYRFFGKFPPPVARHFISTFSKSGDIILDPMCGSGTSVVEGILLDRDVVGLDINPLAVAIATAKTLKLDRTRLEAECHHVVTLARRGGCAIPPLHRHLRKPDHWFMPETTQVLGRIRAAIAKIIVDWPEAQPFFHASFAGIIRTCSRATNQQGRLFLDKQSAVLDPLPLFERRLWKNAEALLGLPHSARHRPTVGAASNVRLRKAVDGALIHPPYFNSYKYSSVMSLEMAWLNIERKEIAAQEIREGFKQGKHAKLHHYLEDLQATMSSVADNVNPGGYVAVMLGDTVLCGEYVQVAAPFIASMKQLGLSLDRLAVRPPKFTEASWVASQRRNASELGANISDYVILFKKVR